MTEQPLEFVEVRVRLKNPEGAMKDISSARFFGIPAGYSGRYSIKTNYRRDSGIEVARAVAAGPTLGADAVGWELAAPGVEPIEDESGKVILAGVVRNSTEQAVRDIRIYCDVFGEGGLYLGSVEGKLKRENEVLRPDDMSVYEIPFDARTVGVLPDDLPGRVRARLIGRSEN
jgi:hypothetical protein